MVTVNTSADISGRSTKTSMESMSTVDWHVSCMSVESRSSHDQYIDRCIDQCINQGTLKDTWSQVFTVWVFIIGSVCTLFHKFAVIGHCDYLGLSGFMSLEGKLLSDRLSGLGRAYLFNSYTCINMPSGLVGYIITCLAYIYTRISKR